MKKLVLLATAMMTLASLVTGRVASAGEKAPVSSLPLLPEKKMLREAKLGVPGISATERTSHGAKYLDIKTDVKNGYCIVNRSYSLALQSTSIESSTANELWHFTEDAEKKTASLERVNIDLPIGDKVFYAMSTKATIQLSRIGQGTNVTAWAFREPNGDVTVLASHANDGRETMRKSEENAESLPMTSSDCSFGAVRILGAQLKNGGVAQLRGTLPPVGEGKAKVYPRFSIDLTVAKVGRDPEPILSVRVRETEPS